MTVVPQQAGLEEARQMSVGGAPVNTTAIIFGGNSAVFAEPLENTTARLEQFSLQERLKWMMRARANHVTSIWRCNGPQPGQCAKTPAIACLMYATARWQSY